jgi:hypothetical protein
MNVKQTRVMRRRRAPAAYVSRETPLAMEDGFNRVYMRCELFVLLLGNR